MTPLRLANASLERRAGAFVAAGVLADDDLLLVDLVAPRFGERDATVLLGLAFALRAPRVGHVGVSLRDLPTSIDGERAADAALPWPDDPEGWERAVGASPIVGPPESPGTPFVAQALRSGTTLVMSRRQWEDQARVAAALAALAVSAPRPELPAAVVDAGIARLVDDPEGEAARAIRAAATRALAVITGGPGTGKTWSIKRLLALLVTHAADPPLRIALAAPTGKAAVRMAEALGEDLDALPVSPEVRAALRGLQPSTLHRLLGVRPDGSARHGPDRRLDADVVVVDEASMVDLSLMRRLVDALPEGARLVLLGDRDQLASVEAGTVLADVVSADGPVAPCVVGFTTSRRFRDAPAIAAVAAALQRGTPPDLARAIALLRGTERADDPIPDRITALGPPVDGRPTPAQLDRLAAPWLADDGVAGLLAAEVRAHGDRSPALEDPDLHHALLRALERYRVLAVHRRGPLGVAGLERALADRVQRHLEASVADGASGLATRLRRAGEHWLGRPLLITRNSYELGLMNGDVGLVLPHDGALAAIFLRGGPDGDAPIAVPLARLPDHAGALAMTVHRSQGSQHGRVALVLADRDSPIQTRELVYTGVTRATTRLDWLGDPAVLARALDRRVRRASGLADLLRTAG